MRSVNLTQEHEPDLALPSDAGMPESGAILPNRKAQARNNSRNATKVPHGLQVNKNEKSESAATPQAAAILDPAAAAIPTVASGPVALQSTTVSAQDQFVSSSFANLGKEDATFSASRHPSIPATRSLQSAINGMAEDNTPAEIENDQPNSTQPFRSAHSIDAPANLAPAENLPLSTLLKSAAPLAAAQDAPSSGSVDAAHPESLGQIAGILPGANGAEVQLNAATTVPKAAESHEASAGASVVHQASPVAGRSNALSQAAIAMAHGSNQASPSVQEQSFLPAAPGASGTGSSASTSTSTSAAASGIQETFVSLDGANHAPAPTWIHAGARTAEAGYQDPALGWVGVRAQVDVNGVHAALVPGSADAAQALGGHLAGLNAYLTEHHAGVETLTMAAPEGRSNEQGQNERSGQNSEQGSSMGEHSGQSTDSNRNRAPDPTAARPIAAASNGTVVGSPPGGVYVSVMA